MSEYKDSRHLWLRRLVLPASTLDNCIYACFLFVSLSLTATIGRVRADYTTLSKSDSSGKGERRAATAAAAGAEDSQERLELRLHQQLIISHKKLGL